MTSLGMIAQLPTTSNSNELNCDTLTTEIEDIPSSSVRDANIHEIVSVLLKKFSEADSESQLGNLECAGRLARMPFSSSNKDAELARVIETNIRAEQV